MCRLAMGGLGMMRLIRTPPKAMTWVPSSFHRCAIAQLLMPVTAGTRSEPHWSTPGLPCSDHFLQQAGRMTHNHLATCHNHAITQPCACRMGKLTFCTGNAGFRHHCEVQGHGKGCEIAPVRAQRDSTVLWCQSPGHAKV